MQNLQMHEPERILKCLDLQRLRFYGTSGKMSPGQCFGTDEFSPDALSIFEGRFPLDSEYGVETGA